MSTSEHGAMSSTNGVDNAAPSANRIAREDLQRQLEDPETIAQLQDILSRLDIVQLSLTAVDGVLQRAETLTDNLADGVKEAQGAVDPATFQSIAKLVTLTPSLVDGLERVSPLLESDALGELTHPDLAASLAKLAQHTELLNFAAEAASGFLQRAEIVVDNVAEGVQEARDAAAGTAGNAIGILAQLGGLLPAAQSVLGAITPLVESGSIEHLAQSKILAPEMIDTIAQLGDALHETQSKMKMNPEEIGLFGLLKTMRDPDAQRAMGFLSTFLKEFGQRLK